MVSFEGKSSIYWALKFKFINWFISINLSCKYMIAQKITYNHEKDRLQLKLVECLNNDERNDVFLPADHKSDRCQPTHFFLTQWLYWVIDCYFRLAGSSSLSFVRFRFKFSTRLRFSCQYIPNLTWIDLWALHSAVVLYGRWKNDFRLSFESLSDLQIEGQREIWFLALRGYLFWQKS